MIARLVVSPRFELFLALAAALGPESGGVEALWLGQARRKLDQATRRRLGDLALAPAIWLALALVPEAAALEGETDAVITALADVPAPSFAQRCRDAFPNSDDPVLQRLRRRLETDPAGLQLAAVDALRRFDRLAFAALWRRARPDLETAASQTGVPPIDAEPGVTQAIVFPSLFGAHRFRFGDVLVQTLPPEQFTARPTAITTLPKDPMSVELERVDPESVFRALGDATRYAIAQLIAREPLTGAELARRLGVSDPTLTHHLRRLRAARLVIEERRGNRILLRLNSDTLERLSGASIAALYDATRPPPLVRSRRR